MNINEIKDVDGVLVTNVVETDDSLSVPALWYLVSLIYSRDQSVSKIIVDKEDYLKMVEKYKDVSDDDGNRIGESVDEKCFYSINVEFGDGFKGVVVLLPEPVPEKWEQDSEYIKTKVCLAKYR